MKRNLSSGSAKRSAPGGVDRELIDHHCKAKGCRGVQNHLGAVKIYLLGECRELRFE